MEKRDVMNFIESFRQNSGWNMVPEEKAIRPDLAGLEMFDTAVGGVASAGDPAFLRLKDPAVVGPHCLLQENGWREPARWSPSSCPFRSG